MKWSKMGKIFDPTEHKLPNRCSKFAQSPQTLVLEDRVRVYFSTRELDCTGKYLSHTAFADFSRDMGQLLDVCTNQVLPLGGLGCFDEHGIFPINVLQDGNRLLAFTTGWNRKVSVSADASIGLAISHDQGLTFKRCGSGPIMSSSLKEPFLVGDAFVKCFEDTYHMWYIYGTQWKKFNEDSDPDRVYKIAYASSTDGVHWKRDSRQIISDRLNSDECQALPTVLFLDDTYHMYFCYRQAFGFREDPSRGYRLGYAWSKDAKSWVRDDNMSGIDISKDGWDSQMQCYPHIFECDSKTYLLYNGNEFGKFGFGLAVLENNHTSA